MDNLIETVKEIFNEKSEAGCCAYVHITLHRVMDYVTLWEEYSILQEENSFSIKGVINEEPQTLLIDFDKIIDMEVCRDKNGICVSVKFLFEYAQIVFDFI